MKAISSTLQFRTFSFGFMLLLGFILLFGQVSCSSDSGNQDASGLYKNGTATLDPGVTDVMPSDLRGFVSSNRIIMFSIDEHLLFDGQITSISGSDFNATVNLYESGDMTQSGIGVTGIVTSRSSIIGTLNGTDVGKGTFSLPFDLLYDRGATSARISTSSSPDWAGPVLMITPGLATTTFGTFSSDTAYSSASTNSSTITCAHNGTIAIPNSTVNIYSLQESISQGLNCDSTLFASDYSGFAAVVDGVGTDDTLLYAVTNATRSVFAVLTR